MLKDNPGKEESFTGGFSRRGFLKSIGGGVVVLFTTQPRFALGQAHDAQRNSLPFNAYLQVRKDGRVTCFTGKIEMGQGVITSLPQMLADELDVAVDSIDMVMGDTDLCPFDRGTWGSLSTRVFGPELRAAGAQARHVLLGLASTKLGLPSAQLAVKDGVVFSTADAGQRVTYAELASEMDVVKEVDADVPLKKPSQYAVMGKAQSRRDAVEKVTGKAKFTADIQLPGMLHARILRPPSHVAKLTGVDTSKAEAIDGVRVIRDADLVAVLHASRDVADRALAALKPEYSVSENGIDEKGIYAHLMGMAPAGQEVAAKGDVKSGEALAGEVFEETYRAAYVAHAPIEPHAALAEFKDGKLTVWASTQSPFGLKGVLVSTFGLPEDKVRVMTPFVGGGFGGKAPSSQGIQAARLAKIAGQPVQVFWTREDEFFWDTYRPASIVKVRSGLTGQGAPAFWDYHVYYAGVRSSEMHYDIPHYRTVGHSRGWGAPKGSHPFATGAWRAPGASVNVFARESQIDIMATKAGIDPLEFRLKNCSDDKFIGVMKAAAERFG
jgi:isoquinoline 1-oxidoreductase